MSRHTDVLLSVCVVFAFIAASSAVKCYRCSIKIRAQSSSGTIGSCMETSSSTGTETCAGQCLLTQAAPGTVGLVYFDRQCVATCVEGPTSVDGFAATTTCCSTSLCNGSPSSSGSGQATTQPPRASRNAGAPTAQAGMTSRHLAAVAITVSLLAAIAAR